MPYIDIQGNYHDGDMQYGDVEVEQRPSPDHKWSNGQWVKDKPKQIAALNAEYDARIKELKIEYAGAGLANSTPESVLTKQTSLIQQRVDLLAEKTIKRSEILNG